MELPGIVTNVTDFGAFVDFGIKQNGLIHVSRMGSVDADGRHRRVARPSDVLKVHQHVRVRVVDVDLQRSRIALELLLISSQRSTSRPAHARFRTDGAVRIVMVLIINDFSFSVAHLTMFESAQMCSALCKSL